MIKIVISKLQNVVPEAELQGKVFWRSIGIMAWVSFMFSALATTLFFATFDPVSLANLATYSINWSAQAIYTLGFLLFWLFSFLSTLFSAIMLALPLVKRQRSLPD